MDQIVDRLFLGPLVCTSDQDSLTHVLSVGPKCMIHHHDKNYMWIDVEDYETASIYKHLSSAVAFIKEAIDGGGTILVHCFAGMSRSSSCVIAYLICEHKLTFFDALK